MNTIYVITVTSLILIIGVLADGELNIRKDLEELCRLNKNAPVITKLSEVKQLIELLKSDGSAVYCPDNVRGAILALEPVIGLESVCSEVAADEIVDFWAHYVNEKSKLKKYLPLPLRNFFISFGLQVSKICKDTMIDELGKVSAENGISQEEIDLVTKPMKDNKKITDLFGEEPELESLMMVVRIDSDKTSLDGKCFFELDKRRKIKMPPKERKYFEMMKQRCRYKFKPIYETLISPIVRLAAIGLNYNGSPVADDFEAFKRDPAYLDWFSAVIACEPALRTDAVLIRKQKLNAMGQKITLAVLDDEDIAELKEKTGLPLKDLRHYDGIKYKVDGAKLDDLVIDTSDDYLMKSMEHYDKGLKEVTKFGYSLAEKFPKLVKASLTNDRSRFGLNPTELDKKGAAKTGFSGLSLGRAITITLGFISAVGIATALGIVCTNKWPLAPLWVLGNVFIMGMTVAQMALNWFFIDHNISDLI